MLKKILILALLSSFTLAHQGATGVVKERMDVMSSISKANKTLSNMSRLKMKFDSEKVNASASIIAEHAGESLLELFPDQSLSSESDAKAVIWTKWEDFSQLSFDMESAATALVDVNQETKFAAAYKRLGKTCSGCHRQFRAKKR